MDTVFPVELCVVCVSPRKPPMLQAFTQNVSAGGMCLEMNFFDAQAEEAIRSPGAVLDLTINPVFSTHPIRARARVVWCRKHGVLQSSRYLVGVSYIDIDDKARKRIVRYAKQLLWTPRLAGAVFLLMLAATAGLFWHDRQVVRENGILVAKLLESADEKTDVTADLFLLQNNRAGLTKELTQARRKAVDLETQLTSLSAENTEQKQSYEAQIQVFQNRQKEIEAELAHLKTGRTKLRETYQALEKKSEGMQSSVLNQMQGWLQSHQNLKTGLVASFEGDAALEDQAFIYDQSLVAQVFLIFGSTKDAEAILEFYRSRAKKIAGAFANSYDTVSGAVIEPIVHVGPNVWLGIAALQYEHKVKDGRFLPLAREIGSWVMQLQDFEGGVKGGPTVSWYSTEHNLDAYAFFSMLHQVTGEKKYEEARAKVLSWIQKYAYSQKEKRMQRGKGDATIATDTFSWAIAALGPKTLSEIQFDPEGIIAFAEEHCGVKVPYYRPDGSSVQVQGFDFAKAQNIGRGGIVSTEWTAQMIVTYRVLAEYFRGLGETDKADGYQDKAIFYMNELQKLIITSPSRTGQGRGCLPYASMDNADTGHGWRTPKGSRTGSVAGTSYGVFAWMSFNPFQLDQTLDK